MYHITRRDQHTNETLYYRENISAEAQFIKTKATSSVYTKANAIDLMQYLVHSYEIDGKWNFDFDMEEAAAQAF